MIDAPLDRRHGGSPDAAVAVIVPVFNRADLVVRTLDGVSAQTRPPDRLVVVDDGSTDQTADVVRDWIARSELPFDAELITKANGGVSSARNLGLRQIAGCEQVAFLDSDDVWPVDFLQRACESLRRNPLAVAATADRLYEFIEDGSTRYESMSAIGESAVHWLMTHDGGIASATLFVTSRIVDRGSFDSELQTGEDLAMFLPLSLDGAWRYLPGAPVRFRQSGSADGNGASNLSSRFVDNHRRWARVYEQFVRRYYGHASLPESLCTRVLASRWYRAGRELMRAGRTKEARECFLRSTRWRKLNKAWLRVAFSYVPRAA